MIVWGIYLNKSLGLTIQHYSKATRRFNTKMLYLPNRFDGEVGNDNDSWIISRSGNDQSNWEYTVGISMTNHGNYTQLEGINIGNLCIPTYPKDLEEELLLSFRDLQAGELSESTLFLCMDTSGNPHQISLFDIFKYLWDSIFVGGVFPCLNPNENLILVHKETNFSKENYPVLYKAIQKESLNFEDVIYIGKDYARKTDEMFLDHEHFINFNTIHDMYTNPTTEWYGVKNNPSIGSLLPYFQDPYGDRFSTDTGNKPVSYGNTTKVAYTVPRQNTQFCLAVDYSTIKWS